MQPCATALRVGHIRWARRYARRAHCKLSCNEALQNGFVFKLQTRLASAAIHQLIVCILI